MVSINTKYRNRARPWGTTARSNRIGVSIHHTVTGEGSSRASIESIIAGINRSKPYGTYSYIVDYTGAIYEIVGVDGIGAAVSGANTPWLAIAYLGDGRNRITRDAERSIRMMVEYLDGLCGKRLQIKGHREINATACPGDVIQRRVALGAYSQRYSKAHIKAVQIGLIKLGYDLGSWGADGDWGPMLSIATGQFQKKHKLFFDEIPGPATLAKINAEVAKLGTTPTPTPTPEPEPTPEPVTLSYVRWTEPVEMEFVEATTLYDYAANSNVAGATFEVGDRIIIVGEVQEEGVVYLMTDYSFADADTSKSPKFTRGIPADSVQTWVEPVDEDEDEDPHEPIPEEPTPEPEPTPAPSKSALIVALTALVAALGTLITWLMTGGA